MAGDSYLESRKKLVWHLFAIHQDRLVICHMRSPPSTSASASGPPPLAANVLLANAAQDLERLTSSLKGVNALSDFAIKVVNILQSLQLLDLTNMSIKFRKVALLTH